VSVKPKTTKRVPEAVPDIIDFLEAQSSRVVGFLFPNLAKSAPTLHSFLAEIHGAQRQYWFSSQQYWFSSQQSHKQNESIAMPARPVSLVNIESVLTPHMLLHAPSWDLLLH
jgi:hypothetical protein